MLIKALVMYNVYFFWNNFRNNLKTLSAWFLSKQEHDQSESRDQCSYM